MRSIARIDKGKRPSWASRLMPDEYWCWSKHYEASEKDGILVVCATSPAQAAKEYAKPHHDGQTNAHYSDINVRDYKGNVTSWSVLVSMVPEFKAVRQKAKRKSKK